MNKPEISRDTSTVTRKYLHEGWQFARGDLKEFLPAKVPGCVHTDLYENNLIDEPHYRENESQQQWIGETDWIYYTTFRVDNDLVQKERLELVFEGLDTYADVYVNGHHLLSADNMFRTWNIDVKELLKPGINDLRICFHNVFKINRPKYDSAPFRLQAVDNNDQAGVKLSVYTRKAGFHFGWDWGPRLITCGLWRPVYLQALDSFQVVSVHYDQHEVNAEYAEITAKTEITATRSQQARIEIGHESERIIHQHVKLQQGTHTYKFPFRIVKPNLWWCNGLGEPHLYTFTTSVKNEDGFRDTVETITGIRKVRLVRDEDRFGRSFYFELNDQPVFIKGANYIPQDNFQNRVIAGQYEELISSAAEVNMNMLRIWGGGIYEEDLFYELCDRYGIMVWQDMMFACGMFPGDDNFLDTVWHEICDNVRRLRNHPCIALWCGNNENEMIWHLAWKQLYPVEIRKRYEQDNQKLFYKTIPEAINQVDGTRDYVPTSPLAGFDDRPYEEGNVHYWDVWHGREPFETYADHIGRFMTEYGFQSFPQSDSVNKFTVDEDRMINSKIMESHQRCRADERRDKQYGNRLITHYMERYIGYPKDFDSLLYLSQLLQAKGVGMAIEYHRRNKTDRYCMGTMYWQLNDCWPAVSWAGIDYYAKWKALHYHLRQLYAPLLMSINREGEKVQLYVISDLSEPIPKTELHITTCDFKGNQIATGWATVANIAPDSVQNVAEFSIYELIGDAEKSSVYLQAELKSEDKVWTSRLFFFVDEKQLNLPRPGIKRIVTPASGGYVIQLNCSKFAKGVFLSIPGLDAKFSDNYFDLEPGKSKTVKVDTTGHISEKGKEIEIYTLAECLNTARGGVNR